MFRVSMLQEMVLGVVFFLGSSLAGGTDRGAHIDPNGGAASLLAADDDQGARIAPNRALAPNELLLAEEGERGAHIDPNGGHSIITVDPNGLTRTAPAA